MTLGFVLYLPFGFAWSRKNRSATAIQPEPLSISMGPPNKKFKTAHTLVSSSPNFLTCMQPSPAALPTLTVSWNALANLQMNLYICMFFMILLYVKKVLQLDLLVYVGYIFDWQVALAHIMCMFSCGCVSCTCYKYISLNP